MKIIVFDYFGKPSFTNEHNYNSMIRNRNEIVVCDAFSSKEQLRDYLQTITNSSIEVKDDK